jgi:hypothetical protein
MGIYIQIAKVGEQENIGFYHVFTKAFGGADFYVGFDKKSHIIYCFLTNKFSDPVRIVDPNDPDEIIGGIPGINVSPSILAKVFKAAEKIFKMNEFPEGLDHCA